MFLQITPQQRADHPSSGNASNLWDKMDVHPLKFSSSGLQMWSFTLPIILQLFNAYLLNPALLLYISAVNILFLKRIYLHLINKMNDTSETEMENCHEGCQLSLSQSE